MKVLLKKGVGDYHDESAIGKVHLSGALDATACGLANEDYIMVSTNKPITCETCKDFLEWAKIVAKTIKS